MLKHDMQVLILPFFASSTPSIKRTCFADFFIVLLVQRVHWYVLICCLLLLLYCISRISFSRHHFYIINSSWTPYKLLLLFQEQKHRLSYSDLKKIIRLLSSKSRGGGGGKNICEIKYRKCTSITAIYHVYIYVHSTAAAAALVVL